MSAASDLRYVLERLDEAHVEGCAGQARAAWDAGLPAWEIAYQPGDCTHYGLLFTVLRPDVRVFGAPGGGSGGYPPYTITGCKFDGTIAVVLWVQRQRTMLFGNCDWVHPERIERDLDAPWASAVAVAVLLNRISGQMPGWEEKMVEDAYNLEEALSAEGES